MSKNKCPKCGSLNIAKYEYGLITEFTDELNKKIKNKEMIIAGCTIFPDSKDFICNECSFEFGDETAKELKRVLEKWEKEEAQEDVEALKRGTMIAKVNEDGWTKCPFCENKFTINSNMSWDGEKNKTCKTRLKIECK
jgi:phage FluMu protein Com